jgi:hypothetical protein
MEKKEWLAAFHACFADMAKTVVYGKHRLLKPDHKPLVSVSLWMVREGETVRESYLLPPDLPPDKTYGFLVRSLCICIYRWRGGGWYVWVCNESR